MLPTCNKLDTDWEKRETLGRDNNAEQWSVDQEKFIGICRRLRIELKRLFDDKEAVLVRLRKAGQLKQNTNVVCCVLFDPCCQADVLHVCQTMCPFVI